MVIAVVLSPSAVPRAQQGPTPEDIPTLKPTDHPALPADPAQLWMAPSTGSGQGRSGSRTRTASASEFARAVKLEVDGDFGKALPIFSDPGLQQGPLGHYAEYYKGLAELRLARAADARRTFQSLAAKQPVGYIVEAAALGEAESDEALSDPAAALEVYERLTKMKTTAPDEVLMRVGKTARALGQKDKAAEAYARVVYEFPFSDFATTASAELETLPLAAIVAGSNRYKLELGRAERFFGAKR